MQITLSRLLTRTTPPLRAAFLLAAQLTSGIAAAALTTVLWNTAEPARVSIAPGTSLPRAVFTEAILTAELVFTSLAVAVDARTAPSPSLTPLAMGAALFTAQLVGLRWTGAAANPARAYGPAVVTGHWEGTHWIYWVGPLLGTVVAVLVFWAMGWLEAMREDDVEEVDEEGYDVEKDGDRGVVEDRGTVRLWHHRPGSSIFRGSLPNFEMVGGAASRGRDNSQRGGGGGFTEIRY